MRYAGELAWSGYVLPRGALLQRYMMQPEVTPGAVYEFHAARALLGKSPGINDPLTTSAFDTSGNGNDGTLTNFAGEPAARPRTNTETDKAVWHDLSGHDNDGALTSFGYTTSSGWAGNGANVDPYRLVFDGTGDTLTAPSDISAADDFTLEFWLKRSAAWTDWTGIGSQTAWVIDHLDGGWILYAVSNGLLLNCREADGTSCGDVASAALTLDAMTHVVIVVDNTALTVTFSHDGTAAAPVAISAPIGMPSYNIKLDSSVALDIAVAREYPVALPPRRSRPTTRWASPP